MEIPLNFLLENFDKTVITKKPISLSSLNLKYSSENPAFIMRNCLTSKECQSLIAKAEEEGFSDVPVNFEGVDQIRADLRSGSRFILDDPTFSEIFWDRIQAFIPTKVKGAKVVGLNERLRFLRYQPGEKFAPHYDGTYSRPENPLEVSLLTLQIYLNEGFEGGETAFLRDDDDNEVLLTKDESNKKVSIIPEKGMVLAFEQDLMHEGSLLKSGVKYTIRMDVMYSYS